MPITVPVAGQMVSAETFGAPVANEVNRLTPLVDGRTPTVWSNVAYVNSWVSVAPAVQYRKVGTLVFVRGMMANGNPANSVAFTLPSGFRPPASLSLIALYLDGGIWKVGRHYVATDGTNTVMEIATSAGGVMTNYWFFTD